jgi:hypothetical protein
VLSLRADGLLEVGDELLRAARDARDVGADVGDDRRLRLEREQRVERGDAVGLGRRDREPLAEYVPDSGPRRPGTTAGWGSTPRGAMTVRFATKPFCDASHRAAGFDACKRADPS